MIDKNELTNSWEIFRDKMISALSWKGKQIMPDREKVINDLQDAVNDDWMWRHADYYALTMERAIALLKEQEPILLENQHKPYGISTNANSPWISRCPRCGKKVEGKQTKFCKYCGQAVKWG